MFFEKLLPARYVKVIETLRGDPDLSRDAIAMATIVQKAAEKTAKDASPQAKSLKPELENLGYVLSLAAMYIKDGTIPKKSMFYVAAHCLAMKGKLEALEPLLDKNHSVTKLLMGEIVATPDFLPTCRRLTDKLEGTVFKTMRADADLTRDAVTVVTVLQSAALAVSAKDDDACREMKPAFENMAQLLSLSSAYIKDGTIPENNMLEALHQIMGVRDSFKTLEPLARKDHPVADLLRDEIMGAPGFLEACRNLVGKTQGSIFRIEPDADASAAVRELVTGRDLVLFRMTPQQFAEFNTVLAAPEAPKSTPRNPPKP